MSDHGFEVLMVSAPGQEINTIVSRERCPHKMIQMSRTISPLRDLIALWHLIWLFMKERPQIVHTHTPKAGLLGMLAAKICGVKIKIHTIAGLPLMTAEGNRRRLLEVTEKLTYWAADVVLPNSRSIMSFVRANEYTSERKLHMIGQGSSNGIDLSRFSKNTLRIELIASIEKSINYYAENKYILSVGRIVKDKGIVELIKACQKLFLDDSTIRLILLGPFENERDQELLPQDIVYTITSHPNIIHIDWSDEVEYYMHIADLLIHTSHREGFPNVLLQAGAMECPIICSDIPGNIDIVSQRETGLLFECGNEESLCDQICFALENTTLMNSYAENLRKIIEEKFERTYFHQEMKKFYDYTLRVHKLIE